MLQTDSMATTEPLTVVNMTIRQILVVDDEAAIREVVALSLSRLGGWEVLTANSGKEALQKARVGMFDAIVLDVMMPEMDGFTFLKCLRSEPQTQHVPIVLLTAKRHLPNAHQLADLGVMLTVDKPFRPVELVQKITQTMGW